MRTCVRSLFGWRENGMVGCGYDHCQRKKVENKKKFEKKIKKIKEEKKKEWACAEKSSLR